MLFINPDAKLYRSIPPLALVYSATLKGIRVVDQNTRPEPKDRFLNIRSDTLGIFVRSVSFAESQRIAKIYKEKYPKAKIKSIYSPIDVQCCYPTIQFSNQLRFNKPFGDNYPFPDFSLFDSFDVWLSHWQDGSWPYGILTSVGCPFKCIYCAARDRGWKARSAKNCVEELKVAKRKYGIVSFEILDDAFNVNRQRVLEFCNLVKPLKLRWVCANGLRADLFDEEEAKAMAEAGCDSVSFGVESTDPQVLKNINKGETFSQISTAIDIAKKYFKNVNGFFIIGLPGSTYEKDLRSIEWMVQKRISGVFSYYVPHDPSSSLKTNDMFYGDEAKPQSDEYPKSKQKEIYQMTEFMRKPSNIFYLPVKAINEIGLINKFDSHNLWPSLLYYFKKLLK